MPVVVHAKFEEVPQKTPGLRNPEGERVLYFGWVLPSAAGDHRIGHPVAIGTLVPQERDKVAGCGKTGTEHSRPGRLVPKVVNPVRRKLRTDRKQADRLAVDKFPAFRRDFSAVITFAVSHCQTRLLLVGRGRGVIQAHDISLAGTASADMKLVTDAPHHRLAVFECRWQSRRHAIVGARGSRVPTRPDEAIAAPERETQSDVLCRLGIVGVRVTRSVVEQVKDHLTATIGHVIDEEAVRPTQLGRPQNEEIRLVFDHSPSASWRFTKIGDDAVLRRHGIYLSLRDALDPQVGASVTEATPCGEALDRLYLDLDDRHTQTPRVSSFAAIGARRCPMRIPRPKRHQYSSLGIRRA